MQLITFIIILSVFSLGVGTTIMLVPTFKQVITNIELITICVLPILISSGVFYLSTRSMELDKEFWASTTVRIEYQERYGRWETESYECNCTTDSKGNRSCSTCYRTVCNKYGPYFYAYNEFGVKTSLDETQFIKILNKWGGEKKLINTGESKGACPSGDLFEVKWNGTDETYQVYAQSKIYENKVRYNTVMNPHVTKKLIKNLRPYNYPKIRGIEQDRVVYDYAKPCLTANQISHSNHVLQKHSGIYGPMKREKHGQIIPFLFVYQNMPRDMIMAQKALLQCGNKNEYIVLINYDNQKQITWYDIITYSTEDGAVTYDMKMWLEANKSATIDIIADKMVEVLSEHWVRKEFSPLNEIIKIQIPTWIWVLGFIIYAAGLITAFIICVGNNSIR